MTLHSMGSMRGGFIFRNRGPSLKVHRGQCLGQCNWMHWMQVHCRIRLEDGTSEVEQDVWDKTYFHFIIKLCPWQVFWYPSRLQATAAYLINTLRNHCALLTGPVHDALRVTQRVTNSWVKLLTLELSQPWPTWGGLLPALAALNGSNSCGSC